MAIACSSQQEQRRGEENLKKNTNLRVLGSHALKIFYTAIEIYVF